MKLKVNPGIFEKFSNVTIGVLVMRGLTSEPSNEFCSSLLHQQEQHIRARYTKENFTEDPKIAAWRKAYSDFGVKPKEAKSSIENLYRIVLSGRDVRRISMLVDLYNHISLKHMLPMGGEDLQAVVGDVELTFAGDDESEVVLLGDEAPEKPKKGEVIYKDSISAICRRWNWREADRTKLTDATTDCMLVIEGIDTVTTAEVEEALIELEGLVKNRCGGHARRYILKKGVEETGEL